jgi:hypothetical protein
VSNVANAPSLMLDDMQKMKINLKSTSYICLALCSFFIISNTFADNDTKQEKEVNYQKWEYKMIYPGTSKITKEDHLNQLGQEGWELVAVERASESHNAEFIFKRPVGKAYPVAVRQ